jgi:hypothetical protein
MARTTDVKVRATWDDDASRDADRTFENIKRETKATERQAKQATSAFQGLGTAIAAFASVEVLRRIALFTGEIDRLASKTAAVSSAFRKMATDSGANPASLFQQIQTASKGTLSNMQAMIVANTALSSGIEPLYKNLGSIIENVRAVSTSLGRDATVDIERVISAINKQEQELLDELGIVARADTAFKSYAASVGKSASALSDLEKRTAFANLVIDQLKEKAEAVGNPIDEAADSTARLAAAWENLKATMGGEGGNGAGFMDWAASALSSFGEVVEQENSRLSKDRNAAKEWLAQQRMVRDYDESRTGQLTKRLTDLEGSNKGSMFDMGRTQIDNARKELIQHLNMNPVGPRKAADFTKLQGLMVPGFSGFGNDPGLVGRDLQAGINTMRGRQATDNAALMGRLGGGPSLGSFGGFGGSAGTLPRGIQGQQDQAAQILAAEQERIDAAALERKKLAVEADRQTARAEQNLFVERMKNARATAQFGDLIGRINPKMGGLVSSFATMQAQFATGDMFGMAITGVNGVIDALSGSTDAHADYIEVLRRTSENLRAGRAAGQDYLERAFGETDDFKAASNKIKDVFSRALEIAVGESNGNTVAGARNLFTGLSSQNYGSGFLGGAIDDQYGDGGMGQFIADFRTRFGDDAELVDVAAQLLSDGLSDAGEAAGKLAAELDPLNRAIAIEFDGREMALRRSAQGAFAAAGADPAEQAKVFASLKDSIANLSRTESARIRRANDTALISGGGGGSPAPKSAGGGTSGVSDPYSLVIDTGNMPPPTIDLSGDGLQIWKHEIDEWTDILYGEVIDGRKQLEIDLGGDRLKIWKKNIDEWSDILYGEVFDGRKPLEINLDGDRLKIWKKNIDEWTDILYGEVFDGRKPLEINLDGDRLKIWKKNIDEWTDILYGEVFDGRKALSINLNADGAVNINRKMLDDWSDLFTGPFISGEPPKPLRYDFNQDGFVDIKRYELNRFDQVFSGSMVTPNQSAAIPVSDAFSLTLDGATPTSIDFQYLADWGFFNVSPAKVKISDIIDLDASGFLDLIQDAVNRLGRDRRIGTSGGGGGLTVSNPFGAGYAG